MFKGLKTVTKPPSRLKTAFIPVLEVVRYPLPGSVFLIKVARNDRK